MQDIRRRRRQWWWWCLCWYLSFERVCNPKRLQRQSCLNIQTQKKKWVVIKKEILLILKLILLLIAILCFSEKICYTEMINLLHFTINVRKSHRHPQCTLKLLCEDRVLLESAFIFLYADSSIENAKEQFVSCIQLSLAKFANHPTPQTKL